MVALPTAILVARPLLSIVATERFEELQVICAFIAWRVESEYMPVTVNCWLTPTGILGLAGDKDRLVSRTGPEHVVKVSAEAPIHNIVKTTPIFLKSTPPAIKPAKLSPWGNPIF